MRVFAAAGFLLVFAAGFFVVDTDSSAGSSDTWAALVVSKAHYFQK